MGSAAQVGTAKVYAAVTRSSQSLRDTEDDYNLV